MNLYIAKLLPKSTFLESLPRSDTLFGAICWGWRLIGYDIDDLIGRFFEEPVNPPFLISSIFPFIPQERFEKFKEAVYLLPKPIMQPLRLSLRCLDDEVRYKRYGRITYVTLKLFKKFLTQGFDEKGELADRFVSAEDYELDGRHKYVKVGGMLYEKEVFFEAYRKFLSTYKEQYILTQDVRIKRAKSDTVRLLGCFTQSDLIRNSVDRISGSVGGGLLFKDQEAGVSEGTGLYFWIKFYDEDYKEKLENVLRLLSDRGIGGSLGVGKGSFRFSGRLKQADKLLNTSGAEAGFVTLSLYFPKDDERKVWEKAHTWYQILPRKGKVDTAFLTPKKFWKRTTLTFKEGSTFRARQGFQFVFPCGTSPMVSAEEENGYFDIYQYAYAFAVGLK